MNARNDAISSTHYRLMCLLLLAWWMAFIFPVLAVTDIDGGLLDAEEATSQGNLYNQLVIFSFAGLGLYHFRRARAVFLHPAARWVAALAGAYCLWSTASLLWSEEPALTVRRLLAFLLLVTGSFGIGAGFYAYTPEGIRTLAKHVICAAVICVAMLIGFRLWDSSLAELLDPQFSLKGSTRISYYAFPAGYAMCAVVALFPGQALRQVTGAALLFAAMVILKGRTMCADALAAAFLVGGEVVAAAPVRAVLRVAGLLLTAVLVDLITGGKLFIAFLLDIYGSLGEWIPWLTLGEGLHNITTLSGRLPLWEMLYPYIQQHLWLGYGFGAFWNPTRFTEAYKAAGWRAVAAHNGFLDELLATGVIGLGLFLSFWLLGIVAAYRIGRRRDTPGGYLVAGWLILFLLFNSLESIFQTFFQLPTFLSLLALFTLFRQDLQDQEQEEEALRTAGSATLYFDLEEPVAVTGMEEFG